MLKVQEDLRHELECVICLELPRPPAGILSCRQQHLICTVCNSNNLTSCPMCKQNLQEVPLEKNRLADKLIQQLN
jgi:hypothetical protein